MIENSLNTKIHPNN